MTTTGTSAGSLVTGVAEKFILATIVLLKTLSTPKRGGKRREALEAALDKFKATASLQRWTDAEGRLELKR